MPLEIIIIISLLGVGILLMLVEIFLLPGISIAGIAAAVFMIGGIVYAYIVLGSTAGNISVAASVVVLGASFFWLIKSKTLRKISLKASIDENVDNSYLQKVKVGDKGIAVSRLNPIGKVMFNDLDMEGRSFDNEFIEEDTPIEIVKVETYNVLVKRS